MRLQVEILRHTLPPVDIIYNTKSSQPAVKTVAELLTALDKLVPLESADGEWGLEDYVVEVAATSDQSKLYECLHYQLVKDVFGDDDEVVVRGLTTDEIRERRQGGRFQILPDGRHLFDGVAWGRRYNINANRPGITIPPRKRRRLLANEEYEPEPDDEILQIGLTESDAQIDILIDEEEDENEDDDYEDGDEDLEEQSTQVITRQDFDDADVDSEGSEGSLVLEEDANNVDEDEVQLLLKEAGEIEEAYNSLPLEARITSPRRKRKRAATDQDSPDERHVTFEGFSSLQDETIGEVDSNHVAGLIHGTIGAHLVIEPVNGNVDTRTETNGTVGSQLPNGHAQEGLSSNGSQQNHNDLQQDHALSEPTSSSGSSDSESEDESESDSSDQSSDSDSQTGSETSGTDSESDSDLDDSSSSEDSASESESETLEPPVLKQSPTNPTASTKTTSESTNTSKVDNPPGSGTKRTRLNNHRTKLRKRLLHLKSEGLLHPDADFEAMRAYEDKTNTEATSLEEEPTPSMSSELAQRKEEMLARLSNVYDVDSMQEQDQDQGVALVEDSQPQPEEVQAEISMQASTSQAGAVANHESPETSQKRARLDIESTRRLLFGSLGLRNPKTPAAEQALREKLAKPVRKVQARVPDDQVQQPDKSEDDSWKDKLIISAIECVQEGLLLSPPPFPFKQRWERGVQKKKARSSAQYYQQDDEISYSATTNTNELHPYPEASLQVVEPQSGLSKDDIPYPSDISTLPNLSRDDVQIDAIIAYKQLQLGPKFEPEESPYRVGRITAIEEELIDVLLVERDRDVPLEVELDEESGERLYNKFEMPVDENRATDDGLRETTFEDMINPKLVRAADVQVSRSDLGGKLQRTSLKENHGSGLIPDSIPAHGTVSGGEAPEQMEMDTPRRTEISNIIKDAGFESALDEKLLQPIDMPKTHRAAGLSNTNIRGKADNGRRSSPFIPNAQTGTSQPVSQHENAFLGVSSPPSVSMVETVDYPHVSLIDVNQSSLLDPTGSSSHQDAQRVSPSEFDNDENSLSHLRNNPLGPVHEDSQASSLASEVPQSQPVGILAQVQNEVSRSSLTNAKALGSDGAADMDDHLDSEDLDSDGFPSLRTLTSSQKERSSRPSKSRLSPPPLRKNKSILATNTTSFQRNRVHDVSASASASPAPPEIKISASQVPAIQLSNISQETSVVDLTVSSDPVDPPSEGDIEYESPRARRASRRSGKDQSQSSQAGGAGVKRSMKSAFAGLGAQRSLSGTSSGKARSRV